MNFGQAGAGNLAQQNIAGAGVMQAQSTAPAPDTLLRAMSGMESLNKRLADLSAHIEQIAIAIGGPWPCDAKSQGNVVPAPAQPPAMALLNSHVDAAHLRVSTIEEAIAAIRRALGA